MSKSIDHRTLYRLPWSLSDNAISWLEPTSVCNLTCDGCYRKNTDGHKSFEEVCRDLDVFERLRTSDCISIAGGDPLVYPPIVDLVAEIKRRRFKPILNTNGLALTVDLLRDLKRAGVFGFTFHVDSSQGRPSPWRGKNEVELNALRRQYAEMVASAGGIACSFNATIYDENLRHVPQMLQWAREHIDIVQTMVFICFRHVVPEMPVDWYAHGEKVAWNEIWYHSEEDRRIDLGADDLIRLAREHEPEFAPSAYLNGTEDPTAFKWLLSVRIGSKQQTYGYASARFAELLMTVNHLRTGRYLSYASPRATATGRLAMLTLWPLDQGVRRAAGRFVRAAVRNPLRLFRRAHLQSIMFIQPVDCLSDGRQSMCDGCPDLTVWQDRLVYSCRLEELKQFGTFLQSVPCARKTPEPAAEENHKALPIVPVGRHD